MTRHRETPHTTHPTRRGGLVNLTEFLLARIAEDEEWLRRIVHLHSVLEERRCYEDGARYPCPTLRLLAEPYADHPDYREEWRP